MDGVCELLSEPARVESDTTSRASVDVRRVSDAFRSMPGTVYRMPRIRKPFLDMRAACTHAGHTPEWCRSGMCLKRFTGSSRFGCGHPGGARAGVIVIDASALREFLLQTALGARVEARLSRSDELRHTIRGRAAGDVRPAPCKRSGHEATIEAIT